MAKYNQQLRRLGAEETGPPKGKDPFNVSGGCPVAHYRCFPNVTALDLNFTVVSRSRLARSGTTVVGLRRAVLCGLM
jgi:hypothetical protein